MLNRLSENNYVTFEGGISLVILIILVTGRYFVQSARVDENLGVRFARLTKSACSRQSNEKITSN